MGMDVGRSVLPVLPWPARLAALCALLVLAGSLRADDDAEALFGAGRFLEAQTIYAGRALLDPEDFQARLRLGLIALFENRLDEAEASLRRAQALRSGDKDAESALAEVWYRKKDYRRASEAYRRLGREALARKLDDFATKAPYRVTGRSSTRLRFVQTDPLPAVRLRLNGREEGLFLVDTGGAELLISPEVARRVGARLFGEETGTFAGGKRSSYAHGAIDRVDLDGMTVANVPVHVLDTSKFGAAAGGREVAGVLGTVFLSNFVTTIDYAKGEILLARPELVGNSDAPASSEIPFWLAGDHFIVVWGRVMNARPSLMFVDTGLAGGGFTAPRSTLDEAGIDRAAPDREEAGGGGRVAMAPFVAKALAAGDFARKDVPGFSGVFPESLENRFGFRIGGLISHDFFRGCAVTFDFRRMRLSIWDPGKRPRS